VLCLAGVIGALVVKLLFFIETHHSAKFVAEAIGSQLGSGDVIIHEGSLEYSAGLPFYTGQKIFVLNGKGGDLDFGSGYPESRHLFLDDRKFIRLWEGGQRVFLVTRSEVQDSILNRFSNHKLFLVGRFGTRWLYSNEAAVNETIEGAQVAGVVGPGVRSVVEPWIDDRISRLGFNPLRV
jgi:hypothetical protein